MTTRGEINSNFYQIVNVDANGAPTSVKPEYLGNISNVANANYANFANIANTANTANSVSVANVSGIGNIATINLTGSSSNVLYGNGVFAAIPTVSNVANANYANFAGTAYSVSGSNVSGQVANANYSNYSNVANTANSVAVANVVGIGNIATLNLDGNVSNVLSGNGTFVALPTVSANSNYANFAGNVVNSAQPNITSLGTLTSLTVSGNASIGNINTVDSILFDTANSPGVTTVGQLDWDDGDGTLELLMKGGNITQQIGTQEFARVFNAETTTLNKGEVVYVFGAQGNRLSVKRAQANAEATSFGTVGFVAESIASGAEGFIIVSGALRRLNTNGLTAGNAVYLSPTTAGAYTTTKPSAPDQLVVLGWIERVSTTVGSIYVKVDNGYELNELHDVLITSPTTGQALVYESVGNLWINGIPNIANIAYSVSGGNVSGNVATANVSYYSNIQSGTNFTGKLGIIQQTGGNSQIYRVNAFVTDSGGIVNFQTGSTIFGANGFSGDGNGLTNLTGANVTGQVPYANIANSVSVANVSGIGNIATINLTGSTSNVLYGNGVFAAIPTVSNVANANYANFAGNAFSVSGSNVVGEVANANYASFSNVANSANSVAVANVSGIGNIATINLTGSTSNVLYGNGVFAPVTTSSSIISNGTSNVTIATANGNIQLNVNGNSIGNIGTSGSSSGIFMASNSVIQMPGANSRIWVARLADRQGTFVADLTLGNISFYNNVEILGTGLTFTQSSNSSITSPGNILITAPKIRLGSNSNVTITGGSSGQVLSTDGAGNLSWSNVTATNANYANFAGNAFSVDAGNIVGTVNLANFATTANSVAGSNVSGEVANANYSNFSNVANSANSVSVANVSGIGNIATINLDGNVSNVLSGNGSFVALPTVSANANYANFAGNSINANAILANTSGTPTAAGILFHVTTANGYAGVIKNTDLTANLQNGSITTNTFVGNLSGTVSTAAQPNITSLGTLSSLTVSGNISTANINVTGLANVSNIQLKIFEETVLANANTSTIISPDATTGSIFRYTANNNFTFNTMTNAVAGTSAIVIITQDATGNRLMTSTMRFANGSKVLSTTAGAIDIISVVFDGTNYYATLSKGYA